MGGFDDRLTEIPENLPELTARLGTLEIFLEAIVKPTEQIP
jgi:hypothetical protein